MFEGVEKPGSRFRDHLDNKVSDWIKPFTDATSFDVALLGAPLSKTSISHSAASRLPDAVRSLFQTLTPFSVFHELDLSNTLDVVDIGNVAMHLTNLTACHEAIERVCKEYWQNYDSPLILLGGDHSVTGASVLGLAKARAQAETDMSERIGILHFDAHHDVRNLEDGGRTNGTPFRTILESGLVEGSGIVQIGLRDFANARTYFDYVRNAGVTVYSAREVLRQGLIAIVKEGFDIISQHADSVYVSFDLDVLDQSFVPGVPAPTPGGLAVWDAITAVEWLGQQQRVKAMDFVCADPTQDVRDLTVRVATTLTLSCLTGFALRPPPATRL